MRRNTSKERKKSRKMTKVLMEETNGRRRIENRNTVERFIALKKERCSRCRLEFVSNKRKKNTKIPI